MSLLNMLNPFQNRDYIELIKESQEHQRKALKLMSWKVPSECKSVDDPKEPEPKEPEPKEPEPKFELEPDRVPLEEYKSIKRHHNPNFNPLDTSMVFRLSKEDIENFLKWGSLILNIDCRNGHLEYVRDMFNCPSDRIKTVILFKEDVDDE